MTRRLAVVGGGLAGITVALHRADAGDAVTLFEARSRLGGLTYSFRRDGLWVDNGQHVFLRCCTAYLRLLDRLGVTDQVELQPRLDVPVRSEAAGGTARLRRTGLPAPLHLASTLARYRWLPPADRLGVVRAALALGRVDREAPETDTLSFGEWLAGHGQGARAVETVWDLIGVATLNSPADRASLALAATVFQLGLLERADAADIGWSRVPLQQLHGDAAAGALAEAGVEVRTRSRVSELRGRWHVDGEEYDDVVLAVSPAAAEALLPEDAIDLPSGWSAQLGSAPILNLHLVLDRAVLDEPFVAAVDSPLQWVFDRTTQSGLGHGQYLAVSLSAADALVGRTVADLRQWALPHLQCLIPDLRHAELKEFFVTREPRATFVPAPGSARWRPGATTALPGLHLAGAWTATGWPATMEGAVLSGEAAAASVAAAPTLEGGRLMSSVAAEPLRHGREQLVSALRAAVDRLDDDLRLVTSYHLGWCDPEGRPVEANPGKAVRPGLTLLAAEAVGGTADDGMPGAVAVELVHNFSLVHDDLMDRDAERRHRPTVWAVWDDTTAVLAGDAMLSLAHEVLADAAAPAAAQGALARATRELVRGQALDVAFEGRDPTSVTLSECFDMAAGKTGALLAVSAELGALLAGADGTVRAAFRTYGAELGIAFQLVDDLLGVWGWPERTGKPVFSDLRSRKKTMPIVWAITQGGAEELAGVLAAPGVHDEDELRNAAALLERAGGRAWAKEEARARVAAAVAALDDARLGDSDRESLDALARFVIARDQ